MLQEIIDHGSGVFRWWVRRLEAPNAAPAPWSAEVFVGVCGCLIVGICLLGAVSTWTWASVAPILVFVSWFAFAALTHVGCELCGGLGTFADTISASLQINAAVYVLACFAFSIVSIALLSFPPEGASYAAFLIVEFALNCVYLPGAVASVHGFTPVGRRWLRFALPIAFLILNWILFVRAKIFIEGIDFVPS